MAKPDEPYRYLVVESFRASLPGHELAIHVRPVAGQGFDVGLLVECPRALVRNYPVGTQFRIKAKLTDREGGGQYLYTSYHWRYEVLASKRSVPPRAELKPMTPDSVTRKI